MTALGLTARFAHLASGLLLLGVFTAALVAGRSDRPTARAWAERMMRLGRWLAVAALATGVAALAYQASVVAGRPGAALDPAVWWRLLARSQFGAVWLVRHGILLLVAALVFCRERTESSAADWTAWRIEVWALAAGAAAIAAWAGHAAAVDPAPWLAALGDAAHIAGAGVWLGALLPLGLLLRDAAREAGADARPYAVLAIRRFSRLAGLVVGLIVITGVWNAWSQVGGVAPLVGTRYGWLLLAKLAVLVPVLVLAALSRRRLLPALSGDAATVGRPAMARLSRFVGGEFALGLAILALTAALSMTPPAAHEPPWWPLSFRLSYDAVAGMSGVNARLFIGAQLAVLGVLIAIVGGLTSRRRVLLVGGGALAAAIGLRVALPPLAVDAYPTTYLRSPVPYQAGSIVRGMADYADHCATCHGRDGKGDGPGGAGLPKLPADLTAAHTGQHTAGDLYWWITHGIARSGMPPFGGALSEDDRWDVINFLRALAAAAEAPPLTPLVVENIRRPVAPDFTYAVGPAPMRSLRDFRGRQAVVLVLFTLPSPRVARLAERYASIQTRGAEIVAVPMDGARDVIARLGADPPILFPVVTDGASDIARTYRLFARTPGAPATYAEFLIDRQGYLRARWVPGASTGTGWEDVGALEKQIELVNREAPSPPPAEHVH